MDRKGSDMALDQWRAMTDDQLVDLAHGLTPGTPDDVAVGRILHVRVAQREAQGGAALVKATDRLVRITTRLGTATWVLGGMTLLLVVAAGVQAYPISRGRRTWASASAGSARPSCPRLSS